MYIYTHLRVRCTYPFYLLMYFCVYIYRLNEHEYSSNEVYWSNDMNRR